jgi:hypothetical protein
MIIPAQCVEARELRGWAGVRLGCRCDLSHTSLLWFESGVWFPKPEHLAALQNAFKDAAIEFTNEDQPGVRLRKAQ